MNSKYFFLLIFSLFFASGIHAQPDFDTTFAGTGVIVQGGAIGATSDLAIQPDNKVILAGPCSTGFGSGLFCVIRYNENGTRDTTFLSNTGSTGILRVQPSGTGSPGGTTGMKLQSDGKIVLVGFGRVNNGESLDGNVIMVRLNTDGSLDSSFGSGGIVRTNVTLNDDDRAQDIAIQSDGKIVVVGNTEPVSGSENIRTQFVARYLPDGTLDSSFGEGGIARAVVPGYLTKGISLMLQADGKIITGGAMETLPGTPSPAASYMLTRLNTDGSPDVTFDGDGISSIVFGTSAFNESGLISLAIQSDGRIVALGNANILFRFNSDGSLDTGFDGDGSRAALDGDSSPQDVMMSAGGRIVVVGGPKQVFSGPAQVYRLACYRSNGSPDPDFSEDGFLDIDVAQSRSDNANRIAVDSLGRFVVAGYSATGTVQIPNENPAFSVIRLLAQIIVRATISGQVIRSNGQPASNVRVALGQNGATIATAITSPFGYYSFENLITGLDYSVSIKSRGSTFSRRDVFLTGDMDDINLAENPPSPKMEIKGPVKEMSLDPKSTLRTQRKP